MREARRSPKVLLLRVEQDSVRFQRGRLHLHAIWNLRSAFVDLRHRLMHRAGGMIG